MCIEPRLSVKKFLLLLLTQKPNTQKSNLMARNSFASVGPRRPSFTSRRSRQGSILSTESSALLEENNHEMFSGATSENIPSSISSMHFPHHFGRRTSIAQAILRETSPLLGPGEQLRQADTDLHSVSSVFTADSAETQSVNFRFFSPDQIESAPGGSTLENPDDPIDYNTNWEYSVDKYPEEEESQPGSKRPLFSRSRRSQLSTHFYDQKGASSTYDGERRPRSPDQRSFRESDNDSSYGSFIEDRYRRRASASSGRSSSPLDLTSEHLDAEAQALYEEFNPRAKYQRYYLAEEDIVLGIAGYSDCWWKMIIYYLICIFTFGLGFLLLRWFPRYRINLLGNQKPLGKADWCVIENEFGELQIVEISKMRLNERLSHFLTITQKQTDEDDFEIPEASKEANPVVLYVHSFEYRYIKFYYNPVEDIFKTNSTWYDLHWLNRKNLREGCSQQLQEQRAQIFGDNSIAIQEKSIAQLLLDEVLHPFYVFQVFSIVLWCADEYYYYASCIFIISLVSIVNSLVETKATIKRLQEISKFSCEVRVWRNGFWNKIDSEELVPGDVFEVDPSLTYLPCDALLINGECVVNESMLTGESVPVTKFVANEETVQYLVESFTHAILARSYLYSGTKLLKTKSSNDEPALGMVLRTGFNTTKGSLVRSMLFPKPTGFKLYEDAFKYIGFMTLIACIGFIYSTYNFIQLGLSKRIMILRALDIITIVVPPALPATLTIGTTFAINRLKSKQIFCTAPTRVNIGGKLDVVAFDKTGTLTEDGLDVLGVHPTKNAEGRKEIIFEELLETVEALAEQEKLATQYDVRSGNSLLGCMASCHSLRLIDDELLGDPLDMKMFEFTNYLYKEEFNGNSTPLVYEKAGSEPFGFKIHKEFEFVAALRRMSVIVERNNKYQVFVKGAPEVMLDICDPVTIPDDYEELLHGYTHSGLRVIACAQKMLGKNEDAQQITRENAESELEFAGFIIFENKLKPTTKKTLKELQDASIRTIMCTGDNVLTAVSVGRDCELISPSVSEVYIARLASDEEFESTGSTGLIWEDIHDSSRRLDPVTLHRISADIRDDVREYVLALTGEIFRYILVELQNERLKESILMKCDIYARMSPDEKHELVEQLKKIDYTVGFCGDGANDCGALKAADVGISLSEAEASVAAPFTSRVFEISCVPDVIKEGRSSLVTSFACFKYMSLYSAIQFITVSILYKMGTNLGDFQFLYIDLFLILPLAIFMSWAKPYARLVVRKPTANLVSPKVLIPLLCHICVIFVFQILTWRSVQKEPWYVKPVPSNDDENVKSSDNTVLFLFTNFQYILNLMVLSTGPPYRELVYKNKPFLVNLIAALLLSLLLFAVEEHSWMGDLMQLTNMSPGAYLRIIVFVSINFIIMSLGEEKWFYKVAWAYKRIFRRRLLGKSKRRYKNLKADFLRVV